MIDAILDAGYQMLDKKVARYSVALLVSYFVKRLCCYSF